MVLRKLMGIFAITLIVCAASLATAGVPDVAQCSATVNHAGFAVLFNVPNGNGNDFTAAVNAGGVTDATITVTVNDGIPAPIANYPFEDVWIQSMDDGMVACVGAATADASTDAFGVTQFQNPLQAGGWSLADTKVFINGLGVPGTVGIGYNSPDIDGSGAVNLTDVQTFASDFFDVSYNFRSDLFFDASVNLSDLPLLAASIGASCP